MTSDASYEMTCCDQNMAELANAERTTESGWFQRVRIYGCSVCGCFKSRGESSDPGWVGAKAQLFLDLRCEAYQQAGLEADPAIAVFDSARRLVLFA